MITLQWTQDRYGNYYLRQTDVLNILKNVLLGKDNLETVIEKFQNIEKLEVK
jgi:hypothetical protein